MTTKLIEQIRDEARDWAEQAIEETDAVGAEANTDSPIEAQLLIATTFMYHIWGERLVTKRKGSLLDDLDYTALDHPYTTIIIPQFRVQDYRVDFALFSRADRSVKIAVECDGHNFHERTKEQAQRDKSRDRAIQSLGFKVLRFTGSEIYRKPIDCAREIVSAVQGAIEDAWLARS